MDDQPGSTRAGGNAEAAARTAPMRLLGFHHLTAVSAAIRDNKRFYTETLGMRLVKRSVNQDDVGAYHLFYSDRVGTPGNDITFFDWPAPREQRGNHSVTRTGLRVANEDDLGYWQGRLTQLGVDNDGITRRDGRSYLDFEDPEGQRLTLVADGGTAVNPATDLMVPGDTWVYAGDCTVTATGKNMEAELSVSGVGTSTPSQYITINASVDGGAVNTPVAVSNGEVLPVTVTVIFDHDTPNLEFTDSQVSVANMKINLNQVRP